MYLTPGCEIQLSALPQNFGTRALSIQDPDLQRPSSLESSIAVQHELMPRLSVGAGLLPAHLSEPAPDPVHGGGADFVDRSMADYTPVTIVSPLDGEVITAYNLAPSKLTLTQTFDTNASDDRKQMFTAYELAVNARIRGGIMFGGVALQKTVPVTCDQPDDPNLLRFCDQRNSDIPFGADYKLNVSYPLPWWGLQARCFRATGAAG